MSENCEGCKFWRRYRVPEDYPPDDYGICRLNPPVKIYDSECDEIESHWPETYHNDWCGKYEEKK